MDPVEVQMLDYEVVEGTLVCHRDPRFDDPMFKAACDQLLLCPGPQLTVDLSTARMISSPEIGLLINLWKRAKSQHKELRLRSSKSIYTVFKIIQLEDLIPIEVCGP